MNNRIYPKEVVLAYIQKFITDDYQEATNDSGTWINVDSIVDSESRGKKLGFNITKGYVYDFHGQYFPSFLDFVKYHQDINEKDALEIVVRLRRGLLRKGIEITPPQPIVHDEEAKELEEIPYEHLPYFKKFDNQTIRKEKLGRKALVYLLKRNIKKKHIEKYNIQYVDDPKCWVCHGYKIIDGEPCKNCNGSGYNFYHGRIILPTYEKGKLVYFQGRDFLNRNKKWKYMNPSVQRKHVVYYYDLLPENNRIYITEGPIDAMTLYDYPVTCMMGNKINITQVKKILWKHPTEIIFIPDNDSDPEIKKMIIKNTISNAKSFLKHADYKIKVGLYKWFDESNEKDLNSANITHINEDNILFFNNVRDRVKMKLENG